MSDKPFFSVIMPVYNKEQYVGRAISSVLNQTANDLELIIVCDPSTDNSNEEVEKFSDERIRIFHRDMPGPGGYAARNLGVLESKGEWISFLDADDIWHQDHIEKTKELIKLFPDVTLFTSARLIEENNKTELDEFSKIFKESPIKFSFKDYLKYSFIKDKPFHTNTITIKKSSVENKEIFPINKTARSGDVYAWVKLICAEKFFVWSSHIGTHIYKDVVGVSKSCYPSVVINQQMVNELRPLCNHQELIYLERYANKLIRMAWFENRRFGNKLNRLSSYLYWKNSFWYCLFWTLLSIIPESLYNFLKKIRASLNH